VTLAHFDPLSDLHEFVVIQITLSFDFLKLFEDRLLDLGRVIALSWCVWCHLDFDSAGRLRRHLLAPDPIMVNAGLAAIAQGQDAIGHGLSARCAPIGGNLAPIALP